MFVVFVVLFGWREERRKGGKEEKRKGVKEERRKGEMHQVRKRLLLKNIKNKQANKPKKEK